VRPTDDDRDVLYAVRLNIYSHSLLFGQGQTGSYPSKDIFHPFFAKLRPFILPPPSTDCGAQSISSFKTALDLKVMCTLAPPRDVETTKRRRVKDKAALTSSHRIPSDYHMVQYGDFEWTLLYI
jgi:hypothetical protein